MAVVNVVVVYVAGKTKALSTHSDLPTVIIDGVFVLWRFEYERTEIDSELAFGFLKMGTLPIY